MRQQLNRRQAMATIAGAAFSMRTAIKPQFIDNPFSLGVASGDPLPDGVVLWTRLAPKPFEDGGMTPEPVIVNWRVASDEKMSNVLRKGTVMASPEGAHSVHVDVRGLEPARWYWYQFDVGQ